MNRRIAILALVFLSSFSLTCFAQDAEVHRLSKELDQIAALRYNQPKEALERFNTLIDEGRLTPYPVLYARALNQVASVHYVQSDYVKSIQYFRQAYEIALKENSKQQMALAENGRGVILLGQKRFKQALDRFDRAYELNKSVLDSTEMYRNLFNKGICLKELGRFDEGLRLFDELIVALEAREEWVQRNMAINQQGYIYSRMGQYDEAISNFKEVLADTTHLTQWEKTYASNGIAQILLKQGQFNEAIAFAKEAFKIAEVLQTKWDTQQASLTLWKAYEAVNRYENALNFAQIYTQISDTLYDNAKNTDINLHQLDMSDLENRQLAMQVELLENKRRSTLIYLFGSLIIVCLLILMVYSIRKRLRQKELYSQNLQERNALLKKVNDDKNRIFSIISHDLRGPIHSMSQILDMEQDGSLSPEDRIHLDGMLRNQLAQTRSMMDELLNWANQQLDSHSVKQQSIALFSLIQDVTTKFEYALEAKEIKLELGFKMQELEIQVDPNHLRIIIQNILSNAIKFTPQGGKILLEQTTKNDKHCLHITDNGVGMPESIVKKILAGTSKLPSTMGTDQEKGSGIGMLLTKQLIDANRIELSIESTLNEGTTFSLCFPNE